MSCGQSLSYCALYINKPMFKTQGKRMTCIQCFLIKTYFGHYPEELESIPMTHSRTLNCLIVSLFIVNNNGKGKSVKYRYKQ